MAELTDEDKLSINKHAPDGWTKEIRKRKSGKTAGKIDYYFKSPDHKTFRSIKSLMLHLEQTHSPFKIDNFDFTVSKQDYEFSNLQQKKVGKINNDSLNRKCDSEKLPQTISSVKTTGGACSITLPKRKSPYFKNKNKLDCDAVPNFFKKSNSWNPPRSPYNLIQEDLYHDPWKMLVATICLQKTTGKAVKKVILQLFERFPTPDILLKSQAFEITSILQPLGLQEKKAKMLLRFSEEYMNKQWKYPLELHGIGKYGNDSYRIFCVNEWKQVVPKDHMLEKYHQWLFNQNS